MQKVLILGAGLVARPIIRYLLDSGFAVTQATRTISKAQTMIDNHPNGTAVELDMSGEQVANRLRELIGENDIAVSLLPYVFHVGVAGMCLDAGKNMVTTSYVSDEMRALDGEARDKDLLILNECGLDPGLDHMSAMRVIHDVESRGGKVRSFRSTTGALPAHGSNNNPFGYKFSWSPKGVLLASRHAAKWLEDGREVSIPGEELFEHYALEDVPGAGTFENYPNRDSMPYQEIYGLSDAHTVYRGTFRMVGWCETLRGIAALGWLSDEPVSGFSGGTYGELTRHLMGDAAGRDLSRAAASIVGFPPYSAAIKRMDWLGLFGDRPLPSGENDPLSYLNVLSLEKLELQPEDRDMVVMNHEFVSEFQDGKSEHTTSTLLDYGIKGGDTSIARTVALPTGIAVRMILEGKMKRHGVTIPVEPNIYNPILDELANMGIRFREQVREG
jgi:saccharopine dehydrogenase (NADP+, L-glutamate forming)